MSFLPSLYMSPSSMSSLMEAKEGFCILQEGSSLGNVAMLGATSLLDFKFLERFDVTTVESSLCRALLPVGDNLPIGVPLIVPPSRKPIQSNGYQRLHIDVCDTKSETQHSPMCDIFFGNAVQCLHIGVRRWGALLNTDIQHYHIRAKKSKRFVHP